MARYCSVSDMLVSTKVLATRLKCPAIGGSPIKNEALKCKTLYMHMYTYMAEFQKIMTCGPKLCVAFQSHLVSLCNLLLASFHIISDNVSELQNAAELEPRRAFRRCS